MLDMLTEKQDTEARFHDRWARDLDPAALLVRETFEAVTAVENRWAFEKLSPVKAKRLLDLGCGAGETSAYLALQGARVSAVDVSPEMVSVTKRLAALHGAAVEARTCAAESLPFPDASFDLVYGDGVLHHVELLAALREVRRVLKPGGRAVFIEPLKHNPVIEVYRRLAGGNRTPTEAPLGFADLDRIREVFPRLEHREFWLLSLAVFLYMYLVERVSPAEARYWKKVVAEAGRYAWLFTPLKRADDAVLGALPWLGRFCWNTVLVVEKEP